VAELTPHERLQPFLLDRLRDDAPETQVESRDRRVFNMSKFREAVLRDLAWLLNAKAHPPGDGLGEFPLVERSVLNFGMPDLSGSTASSTPATGIVQIVRRAIEAFEPRIIRNTLSVRFVDAANSSAGGSGSATRGINTIALEIRAQVWALPLPESLYVKTEVDLETGDCEMRENV
jgi:type VI secretion system protein ImpF